MCVNLLLALKNNSNPSLKHDCLVFVSIPICDEPGAYIEFFAMSRRKWTLINMIMITNLLSPEFLDAFGAPFTIWCQRRLGARFSTRWGGWDVIGCGCIFPTTFCVSWGWKDEMKHEGSNSTLWNRPLGTILLWQSWRPCQLYPGGRAPHQNLRNQWGSGTFQALLVRN